MKRKIIMMIIYGNGGYSLSSLSRISTHLLSPSKSFGGTEQGRANVALGEGVNVIINGSNILEDYMLVKRKTHEDRM